MNSHEIDYELIGDDMQIVEIELDPGETVIAEAGAMNYMEEHITFEAKMGDGSQPNQGLFGKLLDVGKRALTGGIHLYDPLYQSGYGQKTGQLCRSYPGKIICVDLQEHNQNILCQKDSFYVPLLEPISRLLFKKDWVLVFLAEKVLFSRNSLVTARPSFMLGVRLCVSN